MSVVILVVLGVFVVGIVVVAVLVGRRPGPVVAVGGGSSGGEEAGVGPTGNRALKRVAVCAGVGAVLVYLWGLLYVGGAVLDAEDGGADSAPIRPCREGDGPIGPSDRSFHVVDYSVSFLPLGFECETTDGGSYDGDEVPSYVNPAVAVLGLAGVGSAVAAGYRTELRARGEARARG
ncbi:hypothetical protein [Streptomyces sp. NPDC006997]|uniref:hypothetical protein n=1 Tax=Streptomyces sp. NPDC006997 TaxID=3155356 RepID=UPI0033D40147